uniref:Uncharacterized protein n=1 Tax=Physcomitrium patens TaxID=3218 RepID=A0A2K1JL83_PHYPA|nr:hypothetical protein PHYPA_017116 [Physcomitrium patens]
MRCRWRKQNLTLRGSETHSGTTQFISRASQIQQKDTPTHSEICNTFGAKEVDSFV